VQGTAPVTFYPYFRIDLDSLINMKIIFKQIPMYLMKRFKIAGIACLFSFFMLAESQGQVAKYEALYIYNICRLVEWPDGFNGDNFVIAIVGHNLELENTLASMAKTKTIYGKSVLVKKINTPAQAKECHLVFFSKGTEKQMDSYGSEAKSLFISETMSGIKQGSDINFIVENNRLIFELDNTNLSKKAFVTSGELKNLAKNVL
jgi:hypothetical protein